MTVYIDVLFCVNMIIDYMMLLTVRHILAIPVRRLRLLIGAAVGGLSSLVVLLPPMPVLLSWTVSIAGAFIITLAAFMPIGFRRYIKASVLMFAISFFYCGAMMAMVYFFPIQNVLVRNTGVYISISPVMLIGLTLVCYVLMRAAFRLIDSKSHDTIPIKVKIVYHGRSVFLEGIVDTGNTLHEPFSGESVIVANAAKISPLTDINKLTDYSLTDREISRPVRMIPYSSVGSSGVLTAFKPSEIILLNNGKEIRVNAYVAICSSKDLIDGVDVLLPAELVRKGS